jgi:hypothetical protein
VQELYLAIDASSYVGSRDWDVVLRIAGVEVSLMDPFRRRPIHVALQNSYAILRVGSAFDRRLH